MKKLAQDEEQEMLLAGGKLGFFKALYLDNLSPRLVSYFFHIPKLTVAVINKKSLKTLVLQRFKLTMVSLPLQQMGIRIKCPFLLPIEFI